jgi:hypothetical protein
MWQLNEGLHLLFDAANRYLEGESSVHELNGIASSCLQLARREQASTKLIELLEEWLRVINRRWNEWGLEKAPLSESEFRGWLREQLPFSQ